MNQVGGFALFWLPLASTSHGFNQGGQEHHGRGVTGMVVLEMTLGGVGQGSNFFPIDRLVVLQLWDLWLT